MLVCLKMNKIKKAFKALFESYVYVLKNIPSFRYSSFKLCFIDTQNIYYLHSLMVGKHFKNKSHVREKNNERYFKSYI